MFGHLASKKSEYSRAHQSEDCESSETLLPDSKMSTRYGEHSRKIASWCSIVVFLITSSCITTLFGVWAGSHWLVNSKSTCLERVSQYSPIMKDVDISYNIVRFNGSLLKENVFRQNAGPEVDAAWDSLGVNYRSAVVLADQAARSGLLPDQVKISPKYGGGFPANVEGLHHLHCLNLLRQSLYYNFDYYHALGQGAFKNSDHILRLHVSHCLDIIRQQLMCSVDTGILGQVWWNLEKPEAYVDFNTRHKCKNFDAIRQWAEDHQLPEQVPPDFLQPPQEGDTIYAEIP